MLNSNGSFSRMGAAKPLSSLRRTSIRKVSKKRTGELRVYKELRKIFLPDHPICEVKGCLNYSSDIHHKRGRAGSLFLNALHWLAVCRPCHQKIEENPRWAKENGYSESRLSK